MLRPIYVAIVLVSIAPPSTIAQTEVADAKSKVHWPGWLGPNRDGWVNHFQTPNEWPKELKKVWQVDVGIGYATPVVADGLVYQYARQGEAEVMWCFDLATGEQKWRKEYAVPFTMGQGGEWHGKGPKSNPILADGRLFTMSISGILTAWDADTGNKIWQRDYNERFAKPKPTPYWGCNNIAHRGRRPSLRALWE